MTNETASVERLKVAASQTESQSGFWTKDIQWPFRKPPPTRDYLFSQGRDADRLHLLGLNESPMSPVAGVNDALQRAAFYLNRYPDNIHQQLTKAVEEVDGIAEDRQVWGNGAGELINRAVALAAQANLNIVSPSPTFWGYERVYALHNAEVHRTGLRQDGAMDVEALLAAIDDQTGIVTFATPGNPSGVSLSENEIVHIARHTPDDSLLMVDEVYHEFCAFEGGPNALEILLRERSAPWLVLRSFSKAYRLAGARVGYAFASDPGTARRIRDHSLNFTISSLGFAAAFAAFEDREGLAQYLAHNANIKTDLNDRLHNLGVTPMASASNFVSTVLPQKAASVIQQLSAQNIICAGWNHPEFPNNIRIGVAGKDEAAAFEKALGSILLNT